MIEQTSVVANKKMNIADARCNLLLNSDDFISILTPEGVRKFVNKSYCRFLQKTPDALIGTRFTDGFTDEMKNLYNDLPHKITPSSPTVSIRQKAGIPEKEEWISWKATGIFDDNGALMEIMAIGRNVNDIIETRREKDKLTNTLNAFKKAIDTNIICRITDAKGVITYANDNFCKISKYTQEEMQGRTHNIVNSGYHPHEFFADMWKNISSGKMWTADIKNKAKDGTFYWVNSVIIPIKDNKARISGYLSLRILIDEQKKIEEERKTYLESLEDMLFMVSHEIRGPITRCQGLLNLMRENMVLTDEGMAEIVEHLLASASEMDLFSRKLNDKIQKSFNVADKNRVKGE